MCDWITRVSDARTVPADRAGLTVRDARVREREHLVPLPEHPFDAEVVVPIASGKTPYLRFERNHYSIPHTLVRQPLSLVVSIDAVRVLHGDDEVPCHVRSYDAGRYVEDPVHLRDRTFEDAAMAARTELRQGLHEAARKLVGLTKDPDPNVALRAMGMLMDRAGLPRSEVVITNAPPLDLSELTVEELNLFEWVMRKARSAAA